MSSRNRVFSGLVWTFSQQFGNLLIGFVVSLVLARILLPEEFGLIAMVVVLASFAEVLVDSGMTQSLIRSENLDKEDYSTVFYFNVLVSIILYLLFFLLAPLISSFYDEKSLIAITRVYCIVFIINAFSSVQQTRLTRRMDFKIQALISIPAKVVGGIIGIMLAYLGFGVWSLVWSYVSFSVVNTIQIWYYSKWIPSKIFNFTKLKKHLYFGYRLTISGVINKLFNNVYLIVIGKFFNPTVLGFYTRAETVNQLAVSSISGALNKVTFPYFAKIQNDRVKLKKVYKDLMKMVVFIVSPILIFAGVLAEPLFIVLFTEKWLPAVPFFQILCLTGILHPIHAYNLNILKVKGRSDLYLKIAIFKKILIVIGIIIGIQFGIYGLLYAQVILSFLFLLINGYYTKIFIDYGPLEQFKDISIFIFIAIIGGAVIYYLDSSFFKMRHNIFRLITGSFIGVIVYIALTLKFQNSTLKQLKAILKRSKF
ncbi:lipopolysaccharide biosynthesis protein [Salegentibacter salarius]|uniref:Capsule biosynthesis protein CapK n=1 Tax=Salegentibacter salarius TaxID=435906 RepID=A0A2N0U581_9FLAO|nr:lipopolysaccharide biosynthesis protein [Salegentibacter salarius]OEY73971.1 lipopolysaccharide biosynthesis protein [Salegentibacter salarius]PKD22171.1 capsule biosynthesis protein CapK [Salegentibacter salarius]SLJ86281.1 Membrane protein involved in the export of O-antigen and teichoic acid [Salegentibacter salarius]